MIMLNPNWKVKPTILLEACGVQVLTCKWHDKGQDKLTCYIAHSPHGHVLNAQKSDQLAPCIRKHRVTKQMKASKYCTKFQMFQQRSEYAGISTMDLTSHSDFSTVSELRSQHEAASIIGRDDIRLLLNKKVKNKEISCELMENMILDAKDRFNDNILHGYAQGSTYVKFQDMVRIHLFESSPNQNIHIIDDRPRNERRSRQDTNIYAKRMWSICINILQKEDETGYGMQFRSIPKFTVSTAMTWTLFAIISSCSTLWGIIDTKRLPFRLSRWEGWLLSTIQLHCFQFQKNL